MIRVAELFWEPRRSGITGHVLGLARALPRDRIDPVFLVPEHLEESRQELAAAGARVVPVPLGNKLFPRAALDLLPAILRRDPPQVLHVHALEAGLWGHVAARKARVPRIVFTPHTDTIRRKALFRVYLALWRRYGRDTDVLLASTEEQRARLAALGVCPRGQVLLGPGGVRAPDAPTPRDRASRAAARLRLGWPEEGPLVGQVGRLVAQKDPLALVRLAASLARAGSPARVVLVGDGPLEAEARALARELGVLDRTCFAGYAPDLEPVYAALDVLVLASRWEGLSVVLLEALARGLAVVAAENEGNRAVVREGETGRTVPPGDDAALARAVLELLENPASAAVLGDRARGLVLAEHDERAAAERIARAYELARARPARPPRPRLYRASGPPPSPGRVSVAIPTYRREGELLRCIDGLLACEPAPLEILVVDQTEAHEEGTARELGRLDREGKIRWIHHSPPSLPGARNRAIAEARGELVLMLDDEIEPPRELLARHARHFEDPTVGVTGGALEEPGFGFDPHPFVVKIKKDGRILVNFAYPHLRDAEGMPGGNSMVRRDLARALGGWDERLRRTTRPEDVEFAQRAIRVAGARVVFDPEAVAVHRPAPHGGTRSYDNFEAFFRDHYHNDTFFFVRHVGPAWLPLFVLRHLYSTLRTARGKRARELPGVPPGLATWPRLLLAFFRGFAGGVATARRARRLLGTYRGPGGPAPG